MAAEARPSAPARVARVALGQRLAGFVYGTVLVLSVIAAEARASPGAPGRLAGFVALTCLIFWLAHVYAHALGHSVGHGRRLEAAELRRIAHREASMLEAAILPIATLLLGTLGVVSAGAAIWGAFAVGLVVLGAQGLVFARTERLGPLGTLGVVAVNLALGVGLVGLKLLLSH